MNFNDWILLGISCRNFSFHWCFVFGHWPATHDNFCATAKVLDPYLSLLSLSGALSQTCVHSSED